MIAWHSGPRCTNSNAAPTVATTAIREPAKPREPGQRQKGADPALRAAGPADQPAPDQRPPNNKIGRDSCQALPRTGQPLRPKAKHQTGRPPGLPQPRIGAGQAVTKPAQKAHSLTTHSWR